MISFTPWYFHSFLIQSEKVSLLLSSQIKKDSLSLSWVFPLSLSPQSERATQMPARNSAASARGDAPGQNRQARPRLINLFPSHPISLWWHIRRQAEMYDVLKSKCILNAGVWGSSCNVTRVQREKVQGLQRSVPNVGGEKEFQSKNGNLCFFSGPGRHQPLLVSFSRRLPPCSWEGEDSQPGARTPYKGKMMMVLNGAGGSGSHQEFDGQKQCW